MSCGSFRFDLTTLFCCPVLGSGKLSKVLGPRKCHPGFVSSSSKHCLLSAVEFAEILTATRVGNCIECFSTHIGLNNMTTDV